MFKLLAIAAALAATMNIGRTVEGYLGVGAASTLEQWIELQLCSQVETQLGLAQGKCDVDLFKAKTNGLSLQWDNDEEKWRWAAHAKLDYDVSPVP